MNVSQFLIYILFLGVAKNSYATDSSSVSLCGESSVIEGHNCSDAQVQFKFENCALKSQPQLATGKNCDGDVLKAFFEKDGFRYETSFSKSQNGWGATIWTSNGVKQMVSANPPQALAKTGKKVSENTTKSKMKAKREKIARESETMKTLRYRRLL